VKDRLENYDTRRLNEKSLIRRERWYDSWTNSDTNSRQ